MALNPANITAGYAGEGVCAPLRDSSLPTLIHASAEPLSGIRGMSVLLSAYCRLKQPA